VVVSAFEFLSNDKESQEKGVVMKRLITLFIVPLALLFSVTVATAELPWQFSEHTRYMVMGDSLSAGYGAIPQTQGYAYRLYQQGVFDVTNKTIFSNSSVPGATSADVLAYQVPQALMFKPDVITITVGGNDLTAILGGAEPELILTKFGNNLFFILKQLVDETDAVVYISNLYTISEIPGADLVVPAFNQVVAGVASAFGDRVYVADTYGAFEGRNGLLLIDRHGAGMFEIHPTNAGHKAMAEAFKAVIE
jgi:lysophospholipase L1-like esterase